jgi:hypothetical protein
MKTALNDIKIIILKIILILLIIPQLVGCGIVYQREKLMKKVDNLIQNADSQWRNSDGSFSYELPDNRIIKVKSDGSIWLLVAVADSTNKTEIFVSSANSSRLHRLSARFGTVMLTKENVDSSLILQKELIKKATDSIETEMETLIMYEDPIPIATD